MAWGLQPGHTAVSAQGGVEESPASSPHSALPSVLSCVMLWLNKDPSGSPRVLKGRKSTVKGQVGAAWTKKGRVDDA